MSTFTISLLVNIILMFALVSTIFGPKVIHWYKNNKTNREKRLKTFIIETVYEYLKTLENDRDKSS